MAKKRISKKKRILSQKAIFNANIGKIERIIAILFLASTIASTLYCVYTGNLTYHNGTISITTCAKRIILVNSISTLSAAISNIFLDNAAPKKGVILTIGICAISMVGNKFDACKTSLLDLNNAAIINEFAHTTEVASSILLITLIALVFCRKAR